MSCGHAYHIKCIADWLNTGANTCPICRKVATDLEKPTKSVKSKTEDTDLLLSLLDIVRPFQNNIIEPIMNRREVNNIIGPNRTW